MTARDLFERLGPLIAPALEEVFDRRDLCVLATRVAIDVAQYFGVAAGPAPVQTILYNDAFARHVAVHFADVAAGVPSSAWGDGSYSVGIGCGAGQRDGYWDGHLIAIADGCFGDFAIRQAERLEYGIVTGPAVVGPYAGQPQWRVANNAGTAIEYKRTSEDVWRRSPDWRDLKRRRPIVGKLIRIIRELSCKSA